MFYSVKVIRLMVGARRRANKSEQHEAMDESAILSRLVEANKQVAPLVLTDFDDLPASRSYSANVANLVAGESRNRFPACLIGRVNGKVGASHSLALLNEAGCDWPPEISPLVASPFYHKPRRPCAMTASA